MVKSAYSGISVINRVLTPTVTLSTQNFGEICTKPPEPEFHFHWQEKKENIGKMVSVSIIVFLSNGHGPYPFKNLEHQKSNEEKFWKPKFPSL